jgi:hypothetical protein
MNEEILKKLIEYLDSSKDFLLEQTPGVIQDLVTLGIIRNGLYCFGFACLISFLFYLGRFGYDKANTPEKNRLDTPEMWYVLTVICLLFGALSFASMVTNCISLFAAIFAPKAYLLEMLLRK